MIRTKKDIKNFRLAKAEYKRWLGKTSMPMTVVRNYNLARARLGMYKLTLE